MTTIAFDTLPVSTISASGGQADAVVQVSLFTDGEGDIEG